MSESAPTPFHLLAPPYVDLLPLGEEEDFPESPRTLRGVALLWSMARGHRPQHLARAAGRPGGLSLIAVLPPADRVAQLQDRVLEVLEEARPLAVLPFHPRQETAELRHLLRRRPDDPGSELLDFLRWRGLVLDRETRRIIARTVELSGEVRTLGALARGVYLSRRALGRRFQQRGLPVPSHWLQFCRLLRVLHELQNSERSLAEVARTSGYPDGFTLSNQMERLVGVRPSVVRDRLGWEWFVEAWLHREWRQGGLQCRLHGYSDPSEEPAQDKPREVLSPIPVDHHAAAPSGRDQAPSGQSGAKRPGRRSGSERSGAAA
jgi:AraC-like DNA-binding protein